MGGTEGRRGREVPGAALHLCWWVFLTNTQNIKLQGNVSIKPLIIVSDYLRRPAQNTIVGHALEENTMEKYPFLGTKTFLKLLRLKSLLFWETITQKQVPGHISEEGRDDWTEGRWKLGSHKVKIAVVASYTPQPRKQCFYELRTKSSEQELRLAATQWTDRYRRETSIALKRTAPWQLHL